MGGTTGSQSGYDVTTSLPMTFTLPAPVPLFSLGTFMHRNFAVGDPSLISVELDVSLLISVDGVPTGPLVFSYTFNYEETPNNLVPCPYPTPPGEGCTDRVTIVAAPLPATFEVDGVEYPSSTVIRSPSTSRERVGRSTAQVSSAISRSRDPSRRGCAPSATKFSRSGAHRIAVTRP